MSSFVDVVPPLEASEAPPSLASSVESVATAHKCTSNAHRLFDAHLKVPPAPRRVAPCTAAAAAAFAATAAEVDAASPPLPLPPLLPPPGAGCAAACGMEACDWWHGTLAAEGLLLAERLGRQLLVRCSAVVTHVRSVFLAAA